jgi:hypothetical protein
MYPLVFLIATSILLMTFFGAKLPLAVLWAVGMAEAALALGSV